MTEIKRKIGLYITPQVKKSLDEKKKSEKEIVWENENEKMNNNIKAITFLLLKAIFSRFDNKYTARVRLDSFQNKRLMMVQKDIQRQINIEKKNPIFLITKFKTMFYCVDQVVM